MALKPRERVSLASALYGVPFTGTVLTVSASTAVVTATETPRCDVGNVMHLDVQGGYRAMAVLSAIDEGDFPVLTLTGLAWVGARPRASRIPMAYRVKVDFLSGSEVKRTIGETTDLSHSGVRIKLRSMMAKDDVARLIIRVGESENVEALGRVTRIVQFAGESEKGYDVAFKFERWIKGEEHLGRVLSTEADDFECIAGSPADNSNWFTLPEVA